MIDVIKDDIDPLGGEIDGNISRSAGVDEQLY